MKITKDQYGSKYYLNENEMIHRDDGRAIEYYDGTKVQFNDGLKHRGDGPAVEYSDGNNEWWLNDERIYNESIYYYIIFCKEYDINQDFRTWSLELQVLFKLLYGGSI